MATAAKQQFVDMVVHGHLTATGLDNKGEPITNVADPVADMDAVNKRFLQTYGGGGGYTHIQSTLSQEWTVQHNLGKHPAVQVEDAVGTLFYGTVQHMDDNTLRIMFAIAVTGRATCT